MTQKPKKPSDESREQKRTSLGADQRNRSYYYDDAHGYENFVDDDDEEVEADPENSVLDAKGRFRGLQHQWDLSREEAVQLQKELAHTVVRTDDLPDKISTVAGIDLGFDLAANMSRAVVAVLSFPGLEVVETREALMPIQFPYIPGLLSFRETPVVIEALGKLEKMPDLIIYDGVGYAHPRRFGIACHIGVLTDIPTIGVAKALLTGKYEEPGPERGSTSPIISRKEIVGSVLRTRDGVKPIFVSVGHRISLETAVAYVLRCTPRYRIPETTRVADKLASYRKTKNTKAAGKTTS